MMNFGLPAALAIIILWPLGVFLCMRAYFKARRLGHKTESWFWFAMWCLLITFIEWWIVSIVEAACLAFGTVCGVA